jgi:hypothetical protein
MSKLRFNPNDFTLGELEDFEEATGTTLGDALLPKKVVGANGKQVRDERGRPVEEVNLTAKSLVTLVWLMRRREDESFTLADARKTKISELEIVGVEEDPKDTND